MENYEGFKQRFCKLSHIDLGAYREKQMRRRIEALIARRGFGSYETFFHKLESDKAELDNFRDYITINVTEFFRTPEHWDFLEKSVIPTLIPIAVEKAPLKIWSTNCSTGEEPYSLAMLLLKYLSADNFWILATDINTRVLEKAARGEFSNESTAKIPTEFREKYFEQNRIREDVKRQVTFQKMDTTQDEFPTDCDLIVCRNALIYFTDEAKQTIFAKFRKSLKKGGVLFLGHTEQIVYYKKFGFEKLARNFYRKPFTVSTFPP